MDKCDGTIVVIIFLFFFLNAIGLACFNKCSNNKSTENDTIQIVDTSYNKIVLDSIEVDIKYKDSVIKHIKYKMKYEIEKVNAVNDSAAVELFKQLCTD